MRAFKSAPDETGVVHRTMSERGHSYHHTNEMWHKSRSPVPSTVEIDCIRVGRAADGAARAGEVVGEVIG